MDRLSMKKGIEKYDDYNVHGSRKGSLKSKSPDIKKLKFNISSQNTSMYATLPLSGRGDGIKKSKKKNTTGSDMGSNTLQDAIEDPQFIEELMSGVGASEKIDYNDRGVPEDDPYGNERLQRRQ